MTHVEIIRAKLLAAPAVKSLVGERIYPRQAPQGAPAPYVVLQVISDVPVASLNGAPGTRLARVRLQVDSYAEGYRAAHALAQAVDDVIAALDSPELSASRLSLGDDYDDESARDRVSGDYEIWR